jgi:hypothetical protein
LVLGHVVEHTKGVTDENRGLAKGRPINRLVRCLQAVGHSLLSKVTAGGVVGEALDACLDHSVSGLLDGGDDGGMKRPPLRDRK